MPSEVDRRSNEMGFGGRGSEAGLKVAIFGASGFLGPYVCTELGKYCMYGCDVVLRYYAVGCRAFLV